MLKKSIEKLELNKILTACAQYAVLSGGEARLLACAPAEDLAETRNRLTLTRECTKLLYTYGISKIEYFADIKDELIRAQKGSTLSCGELLNAAALLRAARYAYESVNKTADEEIKLIRLIADKLYFNRNLEEDISEKIISPDAVSDHASEKLFSIRSRIKLLNERIRAKLSEYASGKDAEFLQDGIVTIRNDRFVIPVKAEHKSHVRGFVHDRSKTGATFFIEPEYVLELNNELIALTLDEKEEVEAILKSLSKRLGEMAPQLNLDTEILFELDALYAKAEYCYFLKCTEPKTNNKGYIRILKGRHPLISKETVVPVSLELGGGYNFLLLSGANTGGKTVTLKMTGLFCLMAACGLFIPADEGSSVAVFKNVFCDVGDSQSIEDSLSTFSSHITNVIEICHQSDGNSLVLIDELGGGTNPDEGQAIAKAVTKHLLDSGAKGIITTHFTPLKEFAYSVNGIENASMEFDANTLRPLYSIKIGLPGASCALAIARRLGMDKNILTAAEGYLSEGARSFENIVRLAEESRIEANRKLAEISGYEREWKKKLNKINSQIEELNREKEKVNRSARSESRRIINERCAQAEEMLEKIEEIFKKEQLSETDLIAARTLKNKIKSGMFEEDEEIKKVSDYVPATPQNIKPDVEVFVKPMGCKGIVTGYSQNKGEAEVLCGNIKMHLKLSSILVIGELQKASPQKVKIVKTLPKSQPVLEINILGLTVIEALYEVDNFIDRALTDNLEEIKVIHGVGTGKLKNAIHAHLKKHRRVESFRSGKYGEGETGVTFIKLK